MTTMGEKYGDGSGKHIVCDICGLCITCGGCKDNGCGFEGDCELAEKMNPSQYKINKV